MAQRIDSDAPDVVWVGLGVPKQELWMARMRPRLQAPVLVGVGAAFDFLSGRKRQAPGWMQARGLEWLFRLSQEPARLLPRYLRYNPAFVAAFARAIRAGAKGASPGGQQPRQHVALEARAQLLARVRRRPAREPARGRRPAPPPVTRGGPQCRRQRLRRAVAGHERRLQPPGQRERLVGPS